MTMLALLEERPRYGLELKQEFDQRTGEIWPLNVGQVYSTLRRLERDGLVAEVDGSTEAMRTYGITDEGRRQLQRWFDEPDRETTPSRDELVLKLLLAAARGRERLLAVIQSERRAAIEMLQAYTRLLRDPPEDTDLGWLLLLDSLIFKAEARIRWLDNAEGRMAAHGMAAHRVPAPRPPIPSATTGDTTPSPTPPSGKG